MHLSELFTQVFLVQLQLMLLINTAIFKGCHSRKPIWKEPNGVLTNATSQWRQADTMCDMLQVLEVVTLLYVLSQLLVGSIHGEQFWWHVGPRNSPGHLFLRATGDSSNRFNFTAHLNTHGLSLVSLESILESETNYNCFGGPQVFIKLGQLLLGPNIYH